jgi:hypothetical protein
VQRIVAKFIITDVFNFMTLVFTLSRLSKPHKKL